MDISCNCSSSTRCLINPVSLTQTHVVDGLIFDIGKYRNLLCKAG